MMSRDSRVTLRSLTFGGLVLGGIGAATYFSVPSIHQFISPTMFISVFALIGGAIQQPINAIAAYTLPGAASFIGTYERMLEATFLRMTGVISKSKHEHIVQDLIDERF